MTVDLLESVLPALESVPPALDAARFERYEIQHQIGAGAQAEVFLGVVRGADGFRRLVAIKRVRSDLVDPGRFATMLVAETNLASQLSHPNVVSILDFDRDAEQRPYLIMEYVDGVELGKLIETGPLPHPVAIFIVRELLSGLGYIHGSWNRSRGRVSRLVHRDVTPGNVLLSWEGEVKLTDFGLAQSLEETMTVATNAGAGTPGYMSPEQACRKELDGRSDLYAAGIVLWEILAHQQLRAGLPGDGRTVITFMAIRRPSEYRRVPVDLEAVAMQLLAYEREERYRTAELAAHDLLCCQDFPRDGRAELARLLDERFPRSQGSLARPPKLGPPSKGPWTVSAPSVPMGAPPREQEKGQGHAGTLDRARLRRTLVYVVLFTFLLALAAMLALLVGR